MNTRHALIASFFSRLVYWQRRAVITSGDEGLNWIVKTHTEWAVELNCSLRAVKYLFRELRGQGAIDCKTDWFQRRRQLHTRVPLLHPAECHCCTLPGAIVALPTYTQESLRRLFMVSTPEGGLKQAGRGEPEPSYPEKVKAARKQKKTSPRVKAIREAWGEAWLESYPGEAIDGITSTSNQTKDIERWLLEVDEHPNSGYGLPVTLVAKAIFSWKKFTAEVESRSGFKDTPSRPTWWFFKYHWKTLAYVNRSAVAPMKQKSIEEFLGK